MVEQIHADIKQVHKYEVIVQINLRSMQLQSKMDQQIILFQAQAVIKYIKSLNYTIATPLYIA